MTQNLHVFIDSPGDVGHERDALPGATVGPANDAAYIVTERPSLSHCVESSVRRLSNALPGQLLTAADVLADIAKNGTGSSIALLGSIRSDRWGWIASSQGKAFRFSAPNPPAWLLLPETRPSKPAGR